MLSKLKPFFKSCNPLRFKIIINFYMVSKVNKSVVIMFHMKNHSNILIQ